MMQGKCMSSMNVHKRRMDGKHSSALSYSIDGQPTCHLSSGRVEKGTFRSSQGVFNILLIQTFHPLKDNKVKHNNIIVGVNLGHWMRYISPLYLIFLVQSNLANMTPSILQDIFARPNFLVQNSLFYTTETLHNATFRISILSC